MQFQQLRRKNDMKNKVSTFFNIFFLCSWCLGVLYTLYIWWKWHNSEVLSVQVDVCAYILVWVALSNLKKKFGVAIIWLICCYGIFSVIDEIPELAKIKALDLCYETGYCDSVRDVKGIESYIVKKN